VIEVVREFSIEGYYGGLQCSRNGSIIFALEYPDCEVLQDNAKDNLPSDTDIINVKYTLLTPPSPTGLTSNTTAAVSDKLTVGVGQLSLTDVADGKIVLSDGGDFLVDVLGEIGVTRISRGGGEEGGGKETKEKRRKKNDGSPSSVVDVVDGSNNTSSSEILGSFGPYSVDRVEIPAGHDGYDLSAVVFQRGGMKFATGDSFGGVKVRR